MSKAKLDWALFEKAAGLDRSVGAEKQAQPVYSRLSRPEEEEEKRKDGRGFPRSWKAPVLGLGGLGSLGLAHAIASDPTAEILRRHSKANLDNLSPNETALTRYNYHASQLSQPSPFGVPTVDVVSAVRSSPFILSLLGQEEHGMGERSLASLAKTRGHYKAYAKGPIPAYWHDINTALGGANYPLSPEFRKYLAIQRGVPLAQVPLNYSDWARPEFSKYLNTALAKGDPELGTFSPADLTQEVMSADEQKSLLDSWMASLSPEAQKQRRLTETTHVKPHAKAKDYLVNKKKDFLKAYASGAGTAVNLRDALQTAGAAGLGGAGGYGLGQIIENLIDDDDDPENDPWYRRHLSTGLGLGGAALGAGMTHGGQSLVRSLQRLWGKKASVLDGVIEKQAQDDPTSPRPISQLAVPPAVRTYLDHRIGTGEGWELPESSQTILTQDERRDLLERQRQAKQQRKAKRPVQQRPGLQPVFRSDDTLAGQVEKYYKNIPGGFDRAVSEALKAQKRRTPVRDRSRLGRAGGVQRRLAQYPKWTGEDLTRPVRNYWIPRTALEGSMLHGYYSPSQPSNRFKHYIASSSEDATTAPALKASLRPQERPYRSPPDKRETAKFDRLARVPAPLLRAAGIQVDSEGEFIPLNQRTGTIYEPGDVPFTPGKAIPRVQGTREHELTHAAIRRPWRRAFGGGKQPAKYPFREESPVVTSKPFWNYFTTPTEMDPRLAEIKRSYAAATGKLVNDAASARAALKWWGEQLERQPRLGGWRKSIFDKLMANPKERAVMGKRLQEIVQNEPQQGAPGMPDQKVAVASALNAIIEKQAQPVYPRLNRPGGPVPVRGGNPLARQLFQGVGGPVEAGVQHFSSPDDYFSEMLTIPYVGEAPLYAPKRSMWQNIRNLFTRPIRRRERQRREREQLLRTQLAVQSLRGHQLGAPSYPFGGTAAGRAALNEPGIHSMQTRPMSGYPRGLNYGQQTFQQAQARNLPFMSQMILNNPGGYRMVRDTGERSHWLHLASGYTFDMANNPDPSNLLDIRTIPPRQLGWARAQRWKQGKPSKDDLKHYGMDRVSRRARPSS